MSKVFPYIILHLNNLVFMKAGEIALTSIIFINAALTKVLHRSLDWLSQHVLRVSVLSFAKIT